MSDDWLSDNKETAPVTTAPPEVKPQKYSDQEIEKWLFNVDSYDNKFVCMIVGSDGTAKSPLALSYLSDQDIKDGKRVVVIDLDGGNVPLINKYQKARCEALGRKVNDVFIVKNPQKELITEEGVEIDYGATFDMIKGVVRLLKKEDFIKKQNIKYVIFDGLSTALNHAENQMRVEKNLDVTGGVNLKFWLIRNKLFKETLDSIKSLPISSFFIGHEDFLPRENNKKLIIGTDDGKESSIKLKTNSMMHQKILCEKIVTPNKVQFVATVLKSKYNVRMEGKRIVFGEVDQSAGKVEFTPEKVLQELI